MGKHLRSLKWLWDRISDWATIDWLFPSAAGLTSLLLSWAESLPAALSLIFLIGAVVLAIILRLLWNEYRTELFGGEQGLPLGFRDDHGATSFKPDVSLTTAVVYALTGEWRGAYVGDGLADVWRAVRQKAHDGDLTIWGKRSQTSVFEPIPADFWKHNQPEYFSLLKGAPYTETATPGMQFERFIDLRASIEEFEREWPHT